ncbi:MAG TPA: winged helix DNA-binding domain-containing protein [Mucilaginibacter sp.]|nr:winged helix DNA-binding domain-containing protein [Mucilaginibacter sp.]
MPKLNLTQLRLQNQHLAQPPFTKPAEIVKWLGAVQAQDYNGAKWALGQRLKNGTDKIIEQAFNDGDILRTHVMRPTWHFVAREDIRWLLELTSARVQAIAATRHRQLELDDKVFSKCERTLNKVLAGGKQVARIELGNELKNAGIKTDEQRFIHIMMEMELRQIICSGGVQGKHLTYALFDDRVPKAKTMARDESLAMLADRYFTAHGPATLQDFVWWSGLTVTDCRAGLEMVKNKLVNYEGYWFIEPENIAAKLTRAYLLPNYDEYIVSYKDRSATIHEKNINKADLRGTIFNHTIIINGKIEGIWKREFKKEAVVIDIIPFKPFSQAANSAIQSATKRYARFLGVKEALVKM